MAASYTTQFLLLLGIGTLFVSGIADAARSKHEDSQFEKELKLINKPANISFQTKYGDTIDCVDIYKQPAFDHPLLKNHKIQLKPEGVDENEKGTFSSILPEIGSCPLGTVPIVRARKEDLLMSKHMMRHATKDSVGRISDVGEPLKDPKGSRNRISAQSLTRVRFSSSASLYATFTYQGPNNGASGNINVWQVTVLPGQISSAGITLTNEQNIIQVGWIVYDYLYTNYTRLFAQWTVGGNSGCYNLLCPGFVQTSQKLPLGAVLVPASEYGGKQYEIRAKIYQDKELGNWWLKLGDEAIGYWPQVLLPAMANGAASVAWGGYIYGNNSGRSPPMGSGHFWPEGMGKAAYITQMTYANGRENFQLPDRSKLVYTETQPCYTAAVDQQEAYGVFMLYGGPGGCSYPPATRL